MLLFSILNYLFRYLLSFVLPRKTRLTISIPENKCILINTASQFFETLPLSDISFFSNQSTNHFAWKVEKWRKKDFNPTLTEKTRNKIRDQFLAENDFAFK